jgi:hypothetical protein
VAGPLVELAGGDVRRGCLPSLGTITALSLAGTPWTRRCARRIVAYRVSRLPQALLAGTDVMIVTCEWNPAVAGDAI